MPLKSVRIYLFTSATSHLKFARERRILSSGHEGTPAWTKAKPSRTQTQTRKLFIWQVQVQSYNKSGKKHNVIELYKYSQETEAKVQEYRYRQSHLLGMLSHELIIESVAGCYSYQYVMYASKFTCNSISKLFNERLMGSMLSA